MTCAAPPACARSAFSEELTVAITVAPAQVASCSAYPVTTLIPQRPPENVIDRSAELGKVEGMPRAEQHVDVEISRIRSVIVLSAVTAMNGPSESSRYFEVPP